MAHSLTPPDALAPLPIPLPSPPPPPLLPPPLYPLRLTQRWEASLWLDGRQLYLGGFDAQLVSVRRGSEARVFCSAHVSSPLPLPPAPPHAPTLSHPSPGQDAARAYDLAALACKGGRAVTNFPPAEYAEQLREVEGLTQARGGLAVCVWGGGG